MKEFWKRVKGYEHLYEISNCGRVKILPKHGHPIAHEIKYELKKENPYYVVRLSLNNKIKRYSVSRLVAKHFISNPKDKPQVNHKDGNKLNNKTNNLEWATNSENQLHAYRIGLQRITKERLEKQRLTHLGQKAWNKGIPPTQELLRKISKPVIQLDRDNKQLQRWPSISNAARTLGLDMSSIVNCCKGNRETHGNFKWKYEKVVN